MTQAERRWDGFRDRRHALRKRCIRESHRTDPLHAYGRYGVLENMLSKRFYATEDRVMKEMLGL